MAKKPLKDILIHLSAFPLSSSPELEMGQICNYCVEILIIIASDLQLSRISNPFYYTMVIILTKRVSGKIK